MGGHAPRVPRGAARCARSAGAGAPRRPAGGAPPPRSRSLLLKLVHATISRDPPGGMHVSAGPAPVRKLCRGFMTAACVAKGNPRESRCNGARGRISTSPLLRARRPCRRPLLARGLRAAGAGRPPAALAEAGGPQRLRASGPTTRAPSASLQWARYVTCSTLARMAGCASARIAAACVPMRRWRRRRQRRAVQVGPGTDGGCPSPRLGGGGVPRECRAPRGGGPGQTQEGVPWRVHKVLQLKWRGKKWLRPPSAVSVRTRHDARMQNRGGMHAPWRRSARLVVGPQTDQRPDCVRRNAPFHVLTARAPRLRRHAHRAGALPRGVLRCCRVPPQFGCAPKTAHGGRALPA